MRGLLALLLHLIITIVRLAKPGGLRGVESVLVRHQLLLLNRGPKRAPNLSTFDRLLVGLCTLCSGPIRLIRSAVVLKASTPFCIEIDKDVIRRTLSVHDPSWLTFLGHAKHSLWSCDRFHCESATLRTHWVLVVMDQFTRRIPGFGVHCGVVDGNGAVRVFRRAIRCHAVPRRLSSDRDSLYRFHQWQANLRVLGVIEIKTVPYVPLSHPFVDRLIGTIRPRNIQGVN